MASTMASEASNGVNLSIMLLRYLYMDNTRSPKMPYKLILAKHIHLAYIEILGYASLEETLKGVIAHIPPLVRRKSLP
jgi:hypothetical protein